MTHATYTLAASGVDPQRWPEIADLPRPGVRSGVAGTLFRRSVRRLPLRIALPDGSEYGGGESDAPLMRLRRPQSLYRRAGATGTIGFGEAYMAGDWDSDDLVGVLTAFASAVGTIVPLPLQKLRHQILSRMPSSERNTLQGSASNISRHYDLSNELFALFLDPTMTYSSALFPQKHGRPVPGADLGAAQQAKVERLLDLAQVRAGTRVLEIGTGWGRLALQAATRGAHVHTITLSDEQAALARQRIAAAGLTDRVHVEVRDYRSLSGRYDAIVSVEMIEAVGLDHVQDYFTALERHLEPGGHVALQAITMPHDRMLVSQDTYTWIRRYIFPGGQILSVPAIESAVLEHTSLAITDRRALGMHYAQTLRQWRERFLAARPDVLALGFDEIFIRMWEYYLAYSEAGFRAGYLDVYQLALAGEKGA